MPRRIFRDEKYEDIYQKLYEGEEAVFNQLKDVFLMALCIGYKMGIRTPISKRGKEFLWDAFQSDTEETIINAIALAESKNVRILVNEQGDCDDKVTIIEEYANTGIQYLKSEVLDKDGHLVENLLTFIEAQHQEEEDDIFSFEGFTI